MANSGPVILFVCLFALLIIVGASLLAYSAYSFFVVVQDTAAGLDEVKWPGEPPGEWLAPAVVLAWLVLVWLAPLGMVLRAAAPGLFAEDPALVLLLVGAVLWLFFPIGALSSLSGHSRWMVFSPNLLAKLSRIGPTTLGFYAATLGLIGLVLALGYVAVAHSGLLIPVAAGVGAAALLIYARLLGRVAWKVNQLGKLAPTGGRSPVRVFGGHKPEDESSPKKKRRKRLETKAPPGAIMEAPDVFGAPEKEEPRPKRRASPLLDEEPEPYALLDEPPPPRPVPVAEPEASPLEKRLAERTPQAKPPAVALLSGVFEFPFYQTSLQSWFYLALLGTFAGAILRATLEFAP